MPFIRKKIHQGETGFGDDLAELRELRGYTRESLARLTGIHPTVIAALEENRLRDLTDPAYAERHVRVLASQLEGSVDFFVDKYQELMLKQGFSVEPREMLRPRVRKRDLLVSSKLSIVLVSIVLVTLIGSYLVHQARQMSELPRLEIVLPAEGQRLEVARVEVKGTTDTAANVTVNSEQVLVGGDGSFSANVNVPQGLSTIVIQARRRYSAPVTVERHVVFEREPPPEEPQETAATTTPGETSATGTR